jgi:uncharacterized membrane protein
MISVSSGVQRWYFNTTEACTQFIMSIFTGVVICSNEIMRVTFGVSVSENHLAHFCTQAILQILHLLCTITFL